jgi:hypothetical protein
VQELAHGFHRFGAIGAGEQAVVADAVSAIYLFVVVRTHPDYTSKIRD